LLLTGEAFAQAGAATPAVPPALTQLPPALTSPPPLQATPAADGGMTLDEAMQRALTANATIAAARLRRAMAVAELGVASERLNPEARVEIERETPNEAFSMAFPWEAGGKRGRRIAVGEAAIRTSEAELAVTVAEIRASVRRAYFTRLIAESRLALQNELQILAARATDAAQQRFDAGSAPRLEVLQAQLALAETQNQATAAQGEATAARAALNALLALPLDSPTPLSTTLESVSATTADVAIARARSASAELALLDRRLEQQRARIALARSLRTPDVTPEATITHGNAPDFNIGWRAAVAVAVPLFTRHRAGVELEQATLTQLTAERDAAMARITGEVTAAAAISEAQRRLFLRYRDEILPQALQVESMAEDSYRLGRTGIAAYLQALQATRDARLRSLQAASDFQTALADLERAIGAPLP
jgi:cobalt-zinc-cadmium efflux system outer membrane protein